MSINVLVSKKTNRKVHTRPLAHRWTASIRHGLSVRSNSLAGNSVWPSGNCVFTRFCASSMCTASWHAVSYAANMTGSSALRNLRYSEIISFSTGRSSNTKHEKREARSAGASGSSAPEKSSSVNSSSCALPMLDATWPLSSTRPSTRDTYPSSRMTSSRASYSGRNWSSSSVSRSDR